MEHTMAADIDGVKEALTKKPTIKRRDLLSSGSTLINLACTGRPYGAYLKGTYVFFVGQSTSGKTWLTLQALAEASINKHFDDYQLIHDNIEHGALMDIGRYFGPKLAARITPPAGTPDAPVFSETAENLYDNIENAIDRGPCIYIADSFDCLTSEQEDKKFKEQRTARKKGKDGKGDYGDGKARINSRNIRRLIPRLRDTGSIFIGISQERDDIGSMFGGKTHSGGHALKFYATFQMWTNVAGKIKKTYKDKPRTIGVRAKVAVKKNRLTGVERTVDVPIYYSYGMDDVGSCIDFLVNEKHWKKSGANIKAPELDFAGTRDALIRKVEDGHLQNDLGDLVKGVWVAIERACSVDRPPRYG